MSNIDNLVEQLGKLTVVEAGELSKKLEKAWNLNLSELTAGAQPAPIVKEESATVDVLLTGFASDKKISVIKVVRGFKDCLLYTSPSPRDRQKSRMPSSA